MASCFWVIKYKGGDICMGEISSSLRTSSCSQHSGYAHYPGLAYSVPLAVAVGSVMWPKLDQWDPIRGLFFFFWKEKLSFSWIGAARSRCGGRTHMKNPVQGSPVQRKAMSADRDGYSKISIIFSSGNPADAVTFCSAPTKVQIGPPLHLLLI